MNTEVKYKYIKSNMTVVKNLVKCGDVSGKVISQYKIYEIFLSKKDPLRMQNYQDTAEECRCSVGTVMNAVKSMETSISI